MKNTLIISAIALLIAYSTLETYINYSYDKAMCPLVIKTVNDSFDIAKLHSNIEAYKDSIIKLHKQIFDLCQEVHIDDSISISIMNPEQTIRMMQAWRTANNEW